ASDRMSRFASSHAEKPRSSCFQRSRTATDSSLPMRDMAYSAEVCDEFRPQHPLPSNALLMWRAYNLKSVDVYNVCTFRTVVSRPTSPRFWQERGHPLR